MSTSNGTSRKRERDDRIDFEYTGREAVPFDVTHLRFYSSVTEVHETALFKQCAKLTEVVLNDGLQTIGVAAFERCTKLESIILPSTVTEIDNWAFHGCSSLKEVVLNEGLKKIGVKAFEQCTSLQSITIPSTVVEIGTTAFASCNLQEVVLTKGLQRIGQYAFYGCSSLVNITIPSTVAQISDRAFQFCNNLRVVELQGIVEKIGKDAFGSCPLLEKFTFPIISTRLDNIIKDGHWLEAEGKIDQIQDLVERRGSEIFVSAAVMRRSINWDTIKHVIDWINTLITHYETKEATSLFELALWKANLDRASDMTREACRTRGNYRSNRGKYRIEVPGPVKDVILQYLG